MLRPFTKGAPRCVDPTTNRAICLATFRPKHACRRTIRCDWSARSSTRCCAGCRPSSTGCTSAGAGRRLRRKSCCARCCCSSSTPFAVNGNCIRSERQLVEQLQYHLLFQWFVGLSLDDAVWDSTTFTKNRDRLLTGDIATAFL